MKTLSTQEALQSFVFSCIGQDLRFRDNLNNLALACYTLRSLKATHLQITIKVLKAFISIGVQRERKCAKSLVKEYGLLTTILELLGITFDGINSENSDFSTIWGILEELMKASNYIALYFEDDLQGFQRLVFYAEQYIAKNPSEIN